ncbi:hypothetical protein [Streptomyces boncukensis]|uniref:Zinc-finger domain-containing protein n=1 Tax=Streptomyces boncukensis TaxID=2711219 RepID=A0A6G4X2V6_9ACTN|nr:hypothetical protein [Streptomyces boncukensis]NGO71074.1 hypothetical protein [Streptomyces boncukensis]
MTSAPFTPDASGTGEHPEVAEISALGEGLLSVERQSAIRTHLSECGLCQDVRTSLDEIRDVLGTLPGPARMPEDIAGRIDAALAAEALLDATAPGEPVSREPVSRETANPDSGAAVSRETAAPAPAEVPTAPDSDSDPNPNPDSTPDSTPDAPRAVPRRWRSLTLAAAAAFAVLGIGGIAFQALTASGSDGTGNAAATDETDNGQASRGAGPLSDDKKLKHRVQSLLAQHTSADSSPSAPGGGPDLKAERTGPSGSPSLESTATAPPVPPCVLAGLQRTETPLAIDPDTTYRARPVYLIVLPHRGGDPAQVDVYALDSSCTSTDPSGSAHVVLERTYPRG